jgi:AmmeMemoRadiSam system protein B
MRAPLLVLVLALLSESGTGASAQPACDGQSIRAFYPQPQLFERAFAVAKEQSTARMRIGGLTVPHHLVAADLIARTFALVEPEQFDKIIVLSPDHFRRSRRPFAVTRRPFDTAFGPVCTNATDISSLLAHPSLVEESDLFEREHGVGAVLPFVRHFMPEIPIVPIAVSITSRRSEWDELIALLDRIVTPRTLVVQSTDFSHYLSPGEAALHDQWTLNVLSAADVDAAARFQQPAQLDSRGSQYIQMQLQARQGVNPIVLFNVNSQTYSSEYEPETTSYIAQIYPREPLRHVLPAMAGSKVVCVAGDVFLGRFLSSILRDPRSAELLAQSVKSILGGCPLVVNFEGAIGSPRAPARTDLTLVMSRRRTLAWLRKLKVIAVSLANNHSRDLGARGYRRTVRALSAAGIRVLEHGRMTDLSIFRITALSDVDNTADRGTDRIKETEIATIARSPARPPLVTFLHWGTEFSNHTGPHEQALIQRLAQAGVGLVVGAHPHVHSEKIELLPGGEGILAYSLGNFLFDQMSPPSSGAILELRLFTQGTFFARLLPVPNFYDEVRHSRQ